MAASVVCPSDTITEDMELTPGMVVVGDTPGAPLQLTVVDFTDHVVERLPFRIHTVRTACYESFVNSPSWVSGRWASNRVEHSGWSADRLPIVPHPDLCARGSEGGQAVSPSWGQRFSAALP
jgi:hypothetical protein